MKLTLSIKLAGTMVLISLVLLARYSPPLARNHDAATAPSKQMPRSLAMAESGKGSELGLEKYCDAALGAEKLEWQLNALQPGWKPPRPES